MSVATAPLGYPSRRGYLVAVGCLLGPGIAAAFPVTDELNPGITANQPVPTETDLRHQLLLQSGLGAAANTGGWTILPAVGAYEYCTVLSSATNRRWDLVTVPGQFNPTAPPVGSTAQAVTGYITSTHQINEDLTMNSSAAYSMNTITAPTGTGTGQQRTVAANVGLQYALSQTVVTTVSYSFFEQFSPLPDQTIYQNVFLVGINKQF